jgi:hypothetical protein
MRMYQMSIILATFVLMDVEKNNKNVWVLVSQQDSVTQDGACASARILLDYWMQCSWSIRNFGWAGCYTTRDIVDCGTDSLSHTVVSAQSGILDEFSNMSYCSLSVWVTYSTGTISTTDTSSRPLKQKSAEKYRARLERFTEFMYRFCYCCTTDIYRPYCHLFGCD